MKDLILKYLVCKMSLGLGYSISLEELESLKNFLEIKKIKFNKNYNDKYIENNDGVLTAKYNLTRNVLDVFSISKEEYSLLKEFINRFVHPLKIEKEDNENIKRCEVILIYLMDALNMIDKNKKVSSFDQMKEYEIDKKFVYLFDNMTKKVSYLLSRDEELSISNVLFSYRRFCNYALIDRNLNKALTKYTKDNKYKFKLEFDSPYFNMSHNNVDMLIVGGKDSIYGGGPIYIRFNNGQESDIFKSIREEQYHASEEKIIRLRMKKD